ncbi:histidine phosphatase family protein [Roseovarius nanhaiticus]|uniref:Phosphohistidine phosphatase SixA n=1 Tax=Roseovarius nanhaiticus TaxID=573024 RepID=A0A1N7HI80_9RHOB|nr:histidine phosphatase family protein [Roseovarius nanhaiticus]SEK93594.1 Phosphohistidine phosphatase SixA [Roseovarius nanhaiticus]SIS24390.1 Phosphohistidine phosphatase SixA [Roseovarius nanhaiticus]
MRVWILGLIMICLPAGLAAQDARALDRPNTVLLMRHALAPGTGDPENFVLGDCSTQRNLSDAGRAQAQRIGQALRSAGIIPTHVFTSEWCRARETAELLNLGEVSPLPALNSHFAGRGDRAAQTRAVLARLADLPEGARPILVTHQVNISALTGTFARSGEIVMTVQNENGQLVEAGRFLIDP